MRARLGVLAVLVTGATWSGVGEAIADAVLQSSAGDLFPKQIAVAVGVSVQVETTTVVFEFASLSGGGSHVLTVPSPVGAYPVGVDLDRGNGFVALPITDEPPLPGAGGGGASAAVRVWAGQTPLVANLHDLEPGPLTVRVRFLRLLRRYKGQVTFEVGAARCPLRASSDPGATLSLTATIRTLRPLESISGAQLQLTQPAPTRALLTLQPTPLSGAASFSITYEEHAKGIGAHFLTHRTSRADPMGGASGYFLLTLDADMVTVAEPRTLNLVIDKSGSMSGSKIDQAQKAALAMLDNLRSDDRFNIHVFSDHVSSWNSVPVTATQQNIDSARNEVSGLAAGGSTNLNSAIVTGLGGKTCGNGSPAEDRFDAMILLSDGLPTAGETDSQRIYESSLLHNCQESRIFTFSVGFGADVSLLEAVARSGRGRNFLLNDAQAQNGLANSVRRLFEDIHAVRVSDLALSITSIGAHDVLPEQPVDLFDGGQVIIVGRYSTPGASVAKITGKGRGDAFSRPLPITAPDLSAEEEAIKYVWATEMVGKLIADMARGGDHEQLKKEITALGMAYQIQTPFTSFAARSSGHGIPSGSYADDMAGCSCRQAGPGSPGSSAPVLVMACLLGLVLCRRRD